MPKINNTVYRLATQAVETHCQAGAHPQVKFFRDNSRTSFSLFEMQEVVGTYLNAADAWIIEKLGDPAGMYSRKRNFPELEANLMVTPPTPAEIQVGHRIWATPIRDISRRYRIMDVTGIDQLAEDNIIDTMMTPENAANGYDVEHGSIYTFELVAIRWDAFWHPISIRPEDLELKKAVMGL